MYKFTNGIVVFDKETRDAYIKAGMHLVEENKVEDKKETNILVNQKRNGETGISTKDNRKEFREKRK